MSAAVTVALAGDRVTQLRVGLSGVSPVPKSFNEVVGPFAGRLAHAAWAAELARALREAVAPEDDPRISAVYRKELAQTLVERALLSALRRAQAEAKDESHEQA